MGKVLGGDKRFWSPIAITSGLTIFFFGIGFTSISLILGIITFIIGIALLIIGFSTAPFRATPATESRQPESKGMRKTKMTEPEYETYKDERKSLVDALFDQARSFDKYVLTLAAGTFGLSLVFIKQIAPAPTAESWSFLIGAWCAFAISILLTLLSFLFSQQACLRQITILEETFFEDKPRDNDEAINIFTRVTQIFNWLSMLSFIVGVAFLIIFCVINLQFGVV